ncbi:rootletin-like [Ailuropoda melanoleuca]|uniref:rootletin-like n=1 Tax=Ailuropoda melanoleuca TaxID=9646 RepID=UPI0014943173|nr:rootletin-like [Ailuropoda melanoleuca]
MSLGLEEPLEAQLALETIIQTLESSVLRAGQEKGLSEQDPAQDSPRTAGLPARIREIVTRNLSQPESQAPLPAPEMASVLSLQEENQLLQQELSRVEDLLAQSRAERDELAIKYTAVSERVGAA